MNHLELPQNLKKRILMYYDHIWKEYRTLDGTITYFIPELSKQLSSEVYLYLRTNLILSVPFLRQCSPEVVQELVMRLKSEIYLPADYIVHKGAPGSEMYLISKGVCEVTITDIVNAVNKPEVKKPERRRNMNRRRSSVDALKGMKDNFTDFLQQRNLKLARDKEASIAPLAIDEETKLPSQTKTYPKSKSPPDVRKMKLKTFRLADMKDVSGGMTDSLKKAAAAMSPKGSGRGIAGGLHASFGRRKSKAQAKPEEKKMPEGGASQMKQEEGGIQIQSRASMISKQVKKEKVVKELLAGEYFGEICLVLNTPRTCNVRAKTFCELTLLTRADFDDVVLNFDDERKVLEEIIMEKYKGEANNWSLQKRTMKKVDMADVVLQQKESEDKLAKILGALDTRLRNIEDTMHTHMRQTEKAVKRISKAGKRMTNQGRMTSQGSMEKFYEDNSDDGGNSAPGSPTHYTGGSDAVEYESDDDIAVSLTGVIKRSTSGRLERGESEKSTGYGSPGTSSRALDLSASMRLDEADSSEEESSSSSSEDESERRERNGNRLSFNEYKDNPGKQLALSVGMVEKVCNKLNDIIREIRAKSYINDFLVARLKVLKNEVSFLYNNIDKIGNDVPPNSAMFTAQNADDRKDRMKELEGVQAKVMELLEEASNTSRYRSNLERGAAATVIFQKQTAPVVKGQEEEKVGGGETGGTLTQPPGRPRQSQRSREGTVFEKSFKDPVLPLS